MAVKDWSPSAASNTSVGGISVAPGMARSDVDNAFRAMMSEIVKSTPIQVTVRELGCKCDGIADDGATINSEIYARYGGLATSQSQEFIEIHAAPGDVLKFATPVTVRQNRIKFIGNGAKIVCTGAYAFDITQDASGNGNEAGEISGWKITGATTAAIRGRACNFWVIKDNWITANAIGVDVCGVEVEIYRNYIRANTGVGVLVQSAVLVGGGIGESQRCQIWGNKIWDNGSYGIHLKDGLGHSIYSNDIETNTTRDIYVQCASGCQWYMNYGEPSAGVTFYYQDNTAALVAGRTADGNVHEGWWLGGGATYDFDLQNGNDTHLTHIRYGSGNVRIAATCANTFLDSGVQSSPTVTNSSSSTIDWSTPGRLSGIKSISGGATIGKNLTGYVDITGAATTSAVTLTNTEPDAAYHVLTNVTQHTGTPAAGAYTSYLSAFPTTTGFTIALSAAPGVGNTVRVYWMIVRP